MPTKSIKLIPQYSWEYFTVNIPLYDKGEVTGHTVLTIGSNTESIKSSFTLATSPKPQVRSARDSWKLANRIARNAANS